MKRILLFILLCGVFSAQAQRIYRSEFLPFDTREGAETLDRKHIAKYIAFEPALMETDGVTGLGGVVDIPNAWFDSFLYLHLENVGAAYTLLVNARPVAIVNDSYTPADFDLTAYARQGANEIMLVLHNNPAAEIEQGVAPTPRKPFTNSYLFAQEKRSIRDYNIALVPDPQGRKFGVLDLEVIVQNGYNYDEAVTVGYDIYDPAGKLLEFSVNEITVPGRSLDTVRFNPYIYHTYDHLWPGTKAPLYSVTLYTKRDGALKEYIPVKIGFDPPVYSGEKTTRYNAATDVATTRSELNALLQKGVEIVRPDYPQPYWFYILCDMYGMMVVDQAGINAPLHRDDRTVGGTPSNDPALVGEYIDRVRAMYYRSRNHTCIVGFALGGDSGNGYNMYKAYQWLKSVETLRPVIYPDAAGEWNSDL